MAYKKTKNDGYLADTREDLKLIDEKDMGAEAFIIKEASKYKLMSTGEWVKQTPTSANSNGSVDLSGYATEDYVNTAISAIQIPSTDGFATKEEVEKIAINPALNMFNEKSEIMASNPGSKFGIALNKGDNRTLPEAMLEKGVGLYNFWVHKSNTSLPSEAFAKNSSCRGLCCVDTVKETGWYGWILLFDQDGNAYTQYIRNSVAQGWKTVATKNDIEKVKDIKYEIENVPEGTIIDYRDKEIRIFCQDDAVFTKQNVGENGNENMYYATFKVYAPEGAVSLKEGDKGVIVDEMIQLKHTDAFGRKYKPMWIALANYDEDLEVWSYFGKNSTSQKYLGWSYIVEWYDENGKMINTDAIRINLSNKDCHNSLAPYYG